MLTILGKGVLAAEEATEMDARIRSLSGEN